MNDPISFEVFSIEFYDYIYPKKKKSLQQKIWYGNKVKENILREDLKTFENIKHFLEEKEQRDFMESRRNVG